MEAAYKKLNYALVHLKKNADKIKANEKRMRVNQKVNIARLKKINGRINKNLKDVKVIQKTIES